ncbi:metallophosphoesterase family protein [Lacimicrobium alkaliphilum]|uniref:Serine/threonine protein phosphatase n=1 Tax=Lacimicrobium alkaliphilum TaxID=1526571 RepID=A0A0U3B2T1_9ALTE|nr:metallophosphoesterase [Lacimicrobium alkaliphilum]ALS99376.1 serine/threonine protein phosphatase [Lacimicrobium alkaliphilum]
MKPLTVLLSALLANLLLISSALADSNNKPEVALRFAVLGDAEPRPLPEFPNLARAVEDLNLLAKQQRLDFVLGVGDLPHKGTMIQYQNITPVLQKLTLPFYPIMGNEEHGAENGTERFLDFANQWNQGKTTISSSKYVLEFEQLALVMASPDHGRDFNEQGVDWILEQFRELHPKPVLLVVHGAQTGVYPERADKGITHPKFAEVTAQPNLAAVISGDLHMDMDRVNHSKQISQVHYLHIPALERTKIPDESNHSPMFRVLTIDASGQVRVDTYAVGNPGPLSRHHYHFSL